MSRDAFTPLERAALDGLAWELSAQAPDLSGQIEEAAPGKRRVQGPVFLTETLVDRRRPPPAQGHTGRLGTIHVQVDHLEHPIAFQAELLGGRLIALHGDAYGQDLSAVPLDGRVVDQVFRLREDGHPVPYDLRDRDDAIRAADTLTKLRANPDPETAEPRYAPRRPEPIRAVPQGKKAPTAPTRAAVDAPERPASSTSVVDLLFGKRIEQPTPETPEPDDHTSVRMGVVAALVMLVMFLHFVLGLPLIGAGILAFWLGRVLLKKKVVESIASAIGSSRA